MAFMTFFPNTEVAVLEVALFFARFITPSFFPLPCATTVGGSVFSFVKDSSREAFHALNSGSPEHDPTNKSSSSF